MDCDHSTIVRHLKSNGKVQKLGTWVPHLLSQDNKDARVKACTELLNRHQTAVYRKRPFLRLIVTGDEKWCLYANIKQRKEWLSPDKHASPRVKQDLHPAKRMLCVWWDWQGIIHSELLKNKQTINSELYTEQLRRVNEAMQQKRPDRRHPVLLLHDNARPHTSKLTKAVIEELGWEVLPHPPYSPDLAPSDYHLFRSLQNALDGNIFDDETALQAWLDHFFVSKTAAFYWEAIESLPGRWEKVIENKGEYFVD